MKLIGFWQTGITMLILGAGWALNPTASFGDAVVVSKAMSASTIAEIFVENNSIRIKLEIGVKDLVAFKNLLPDKLYRKLDIDDQSYSERIQQFVSEDWMIRTDQGNALTGHVVHVEARKRIKRDPITGRPLAKQPADAELVVYADLTFDLTGKPQSVSIKPPTEADHQRVAANIGFITYHNGLPVSDFRYLAGEETLDLDWEDPWYSSFRNPNLRRRYNSPASVFLYIEPFEVRKEIVIRPVDLQRWIDLDIDVHSTIPVDAQAKLKERVAEFLKDKHPVTIDGKLVEGQVDRIHFISRTLRKTGVIYPDQELPACSATLGVIVIYPIEQLPQQVTMRWDSFDAKLQQIPASATDEAGSLPSILTPDDPVLIWKNYLTHPTIPAMRSVPTPVAPAQLSLPLVSIVWVLGSLIAIVRMSKHTANKRKLGFWLLLSLAGGWALLPFANIAVVNPWAQQYQLADQDADEIMDSLLHNLYHAFDRRQEALVYDQLATSLSGDLLRETYLQTRKRLVLPDQGGAQIKIDNVAVLTNKLLSVEDQAFSCRCNWMVTGTIGHWGHLHRRQLGFEANFIVEPTDEGWKITSMQIINETQPELLAP